MNDVLVDIDAYEHRVQEARRLQREEDAALVRAAGCVCDSLTDGCAKREGIASFTPPFARVIVHDPRCPIALADAILGGE